MIGKPGGGGPGSSAPGLAPEDANGASASPTDGERLRERVIPAVGERYELLEEIGRGGMAVVYRARDVRLRRHIALKVLPPELAFRSEVRQRFLREAQTAAQLSHANIVPIYSVDEGGGLVWFAMGLVEGESLAARLHRESRPSAEFVRQVLRDVADALDYAHARGVIHRDVKPDNILLDRESGRAMVTDFGIARAAEGGTRLTMTGIAVGTPTYMSPEQAMGDRDVDARSDLYSLGVVGYQMLAGAVPFQARTTASMLMKHVSDRPRPLHEIRSDLPASLVLAVERALEKEPGRRWDSAREMRDVLDGVLPPGEPFGGAQRGSEEPGAGAATGGEAAGREDSAGDRHSSWRSGDADRSRLPGPGEPNAGTARGHAAEADLPPPAPVPVRGNPEWGYQQRNHGGADPDQLPPYPVFPSSTNREAREQWRRKQEEWQREVRHRLATRGGYGTDTPERYSEDSKKKESLERFASRPLDERFRLFRRKAMGTVGTIGMLGFINLVTFPFFPWAIFPAWGMLKGLSPQWQNLKAEGVTLGNVLDGRLPSDLSRSNRDGARTALTRGEQRSLDRARSHSVWWERMPQLEKRVRSLHRWLGAAALLPLVGTMFGAGFSEEAFLVMGFMGGGFSALVATVKAMRLRSIGVRMRKVLRPGWRERLRLMDPRSDEAKLESEARKLVAADVLDSDQGVIVRQALRERQQIARAVQLMSESERAAIPDVLPTSDALVERVGALAQALHRLELEMPHDMLNSIESRFRDLDRAPAGADTERRRGLLERQRATLRELEDRRVQVGGQLDSALLVLQQMKLDLLRLRSAGFQSALTSVTSATQEARALSLDIGRVLDAGNELEDHLNRSELDSSPLKDLD